jgi:LysM repeat protein
MTVTKLKIEVLDKGAVDEKRGPLDSFSVPFNPTEFSLNKGSQIAEIAIPGLDSPILQFVRGQNETLTLDLFFDTTNGGMGEGATDVRDQTKMIYQLVKIQPKTHAPPRVQLSWGKALNLTAIVESVQQKFTLFSPDGVPLRATLTVSFREYKTLEKQLGELNLQSPNHTKMRVVQRGDTLSRIAAEEYDDPSAWRQIAEANKLDNPRRLVPGAVLQIPPLEQSGADGAGQP